MLCVRSHGQSESKRRREKSVSFCRTIKLVDVDMWKPDFKRIKGDFKRRASDEQKRAVREREREKEWKK